MKTLNLIILAMFGAVLIYASLALPAVGEKTAPLHKQTSAAGTPVAGTYYIEHAYEDAHTPNMVTVTLADYRGFDTLGETLVVFTAGMACYFILRRSQ